MTPGVGRRGAVRAQAAANLTFTPNPWCSPGGASSAGAADFSRFAAAGAMSPAAGALLLGLGESPSLTGRVRRARGWARGAGGAADLGGGCAAIAGGDELCVALGLSDDVLRV